MPSSSIEAQAAHNLIPLELLDDRFNRLAVGVGHVKHLVEPGLYIVRCLFGDSVREKIVRVHNEERKFVNFDQTEISGLTSAAPVIGSSSFHEYYSNDLYQWTQQPPKESSGLGSQLFILATRKSGAEKLDRLLRPISLAGVKLRDQHGRLLKALPKTQPFQRDNPQHPLARFSVGLDPGGYLLEWPARLLGEGKVAVQPIWLSRGWTTVVFVQAPDRGGLPNYETISIQMAKEEQGFVPVKENATAAELALVALKTGRWYLPDTELKRLLHEKFDNPILGILAAHVLLHRPEAQRELIDEVLQNLESLCGDGHPDVIALRVMADAAFDPHDSHPVLSRGVAHPPMVRDGLRVLLNAEWNSERNLLSALCRLAFYRECAGAPWTMFESSTDLSVEPRPDAVANVESSLPVGFSRFTANNIDPRDAWVEISTAAAERDQLLEVGRFLESVKKRGGDEALRKLKPIHLRWTGFSRHQVAELIERFHSAELGKLSRPERHHHHFDEEAPAALVREITDLSFALVGVNRAIVKAVGNVPTTGWTNPELADSGQVDLGVRFDFVAKSPSGAASQLITEITASKIVPLAGQNIVIRSKTNERSIQLPEPGDQW